MGRLFLVQLKGRIYVCKSCNNHLANIDEVVSKTFHCRHGKAYLFNTVVNVSTGVVEDRMMTTGMHTVTDIYCNTCHQIVGWKYEVAHEKSQKYKEGKFILERNKLVDCDGTDVIMGVQGAGSDIDDP
ncbi:protein yippee-like [Cryptomeria japonica]|uniref:protein yippee-like n=1 Tax=Cryptomeria japonica TaxID=3369 RepID=UPI0025AC7C16|nr:protein yippee-like [Cryptomeria japonica]XP_057866266.1 protein yippee-like [Cryptomeria japonica]XP_057866267.1 protein yippee-like [Cryptomeria japonica]XP_057866268.1 protein yippee-like [Cryptomeria japonica]